MTGAPRLKPLTTKMHPADIARLEAVRLLLRQRGEDVTRTALHRQLLVNAITKLETKLNPKGDTNE